MKMNELGQVQNLSVEANGSSPATQTQWHDHLQLNATHPEIAVKFIQHMEFDDQLAVTQRYSWVTQLEVTPENVLKLVRGGRARWKIENETFNTLKKQGYHLEHNFGHGQKNLSTVFATLTILAFLVDQVQQTCCPLFAKAMGKFNTRRAYWHHIRCCVESFQLITWISLYEAIIDGMTRGQRLTNFNSS